jgi:hypothetical protein
MSLITLHAGGRHVAEEELSLLITPPPTDTHVPIPHKLAFDMLRGSVLTRGWKVTQTELATSNDDARFFGVMEIAKQGDDKVKDWSMLFGLRNSHDKKFKLSIGLGERVFVCDNLAFHAEVVEERKHTNGILDDLPEMIDRAVTGLLNVGPVVELRNTYYQNVHLLNAEPGDTLIDLAKEGVVPAREIVRLRDAFRREPAQTAWSLKQVVTNWMKIRPTSLIVGRTQEMHSVLDRVTGFDATAALAASRMN